VLAIIFSVLLRDIIRKPGQSYDVEATQVVAAVIARTPFFREVVGILVEHGEVISGKCSAPLVRVPKRRL
jgi:hypothetical protein